jgi:hypothetical protein
VGEVAVPGAGRVLDQGREAVLEHDHVVVAGHDP